LKNIHKFYVVEGGNRTGSRHPETHKNLRSVASGEERLCPTSFDSGRAGRSVASLGTGVMFLEQVSSVTKLEVANRELCAAIRMFFADGDTVAVHALACAASEIYEWHCGKAAAARRIDVINKKDLDCSENELWNILNEPRSFFKHPGNDLTDQIVFSDEMNDFLLLATSNDCAALCAPALPIEVQVYVTWFRAVYTYSEQAIASAESTPDHHADRIAKMLSEWFPGVSQASRSDQKRFGARLMEGVLAGRF
jgi:hypothetical protein